MGDTQGGSTIMRLVALSFAAVLSTIILGTSAPVAHAAPQKETNETAKTVQIQPGDSLSKLADQHGSTIQRLFDANTAIEQPDLIFPGDDLKVPSKDENLASRPMSAAAEAPAPVEATPAPAQPAAAAAPQAASGSVWDQLAQCESGGNWSINTGNGFYGGLQFTISSWQAVGGSGLPSNASRDEQIMRGQMLQARQGWGAWPACTAKLGLR